jgi:hypothetical protein
MMHTQTMSYRKEQRAFPVGQQHPRPAAPALIALLVLLAYDLATAAGSGNLSALFVERLTDVSLGAILALIGTAVAFPHRVDGDSDGDDKGSPQ